MARTTELDVSSGDDAYADFFAFACRSQWTDGLPVIPPTPQRVERMLRTMDGDPDEVMALMPPRQGKVTLRGIAANAVMAGCLPEYFPLVVAAVEAINDAGFPLATLVGMRPETPFLLVNGPVRDEIALECGRGCLGPGWRANATIGRALRLIMINLGGLEPGTYARACFASPLQFTFCAGEDEANSAWEPFHVERGFGRDQSVVSVFRVTSYIALFAPLDWDQSPRGLLEHTGLSLGSVGNTAMYAGSLSCLLLFNHERIKLLADAGISKSEAKTLLYEYAMLPAGIFRPSDLEALREKGRVIGGKVSLVERPEDIQIAVMGGPGIHTVYLPGFAHESIPHMPVSKLIAARREPHKEEMQ
jgi:hypothetical protein